jgi:hypothetical protein
MFILGCDALSFFQYSEKYGALSFVMAHLGKYVTQSRRIGGTQFLQVTLLVGHVSHQRRDTCPTKGGFGKVKPPRTPPSHNTYYIQ